MWKCELCQRKNCQMPTFCCVMFKLIRFVKLRVGVHLGRNVSRRLGSLHFVSLQTWWRHFPVISVFVSVSINVCFRLFVLNMCNCDQFVTVKPQWYVITPLKFDNQLWEGPQGSLEEDVVTDGRETSYKWVFVEGNVCYFNPLTYWRD